MPRKKRPSTARGRPSISEVAAASVQGGLAGVGTGVVAGVAVGGWLAKATVIAAVVDPTFITPIVLGTIGAFVGGYLKAKELQASKGRKP